MDTATNASHAEENASGNDSGIRKNSVTYASADIVSLPENDSAFKYFSQQPHKELSVETHTFIDVNPERSVKPAQNNARGDIPPASQLDNELEQKIKALQDHLAAGRNHHSSKIMSRSNCKITVFVFDHTFDKRMVPC